MYADNTSSSMRVNDLKDTEIKVSLDLIKICDWLKANKLSLNALKTELMLLGTTRNITKLGRCTFQILGGGRVGGPR